MLSEILYIDLVTHISSYKYGNIIFGPKLWLQNVITQLNQAIVCICCDTFYCFVCYATAYIGTLVKVKVKLSLCVTKHHAIKAYWGSGGIAPLILRPRHLMEVSGQLCAPGRFTSRERAPVPIG
jgi:hypothetical protein